MHKSQDPGKSKPEELVPTGFHRAKKNAQAYLRDKGKAADLLRKAKKKAAHKQAALVGVWEDLQALLRMLKSWISGEYQGASWQTILLVLTAVLYFVMPLDVIPDFITGLGFFDDAAIIAFIVSSIREELVTYIEWEALQRKDQIPGNTQVQNGDQEADEQDPF